MARKEKPSQTAQISIDSVKTVDFVCFYHFFWGKYVIFFEKVRKCNYESDIL